MKIRLLQTVNKGEIQEARARAALPSDFIPINYPILSRHWFGLRPASLIAAETVADARFAHQVSKLHAEGPRLLTELLAEIGAERSLQTFIEEKIARYLEIDAAVLDVTDGRHLPPTLLHEVGG